MTSAAPAAEAWIRPATPEDLPGIRAILAAHGNDGPVVIADVVGPYVRHLIATARTAVATTGEAEEAVVGFGAAIDTGRCVHLADLFVHPDRLGRGIGRMLLEAVLAGADRRSTFASEDPRALPLYVRAGMQPLWPGLYVQGQTSTLQTSPGFDAGLRVEAAPSEELAALERDWTGHDRTIDHDYWARMAESDGFIVRDGDTVAAFGYARARQAAPIRVLDRLIVHSAADPLAALLTALHRAGRGGPVLACLFGPNPALRPLLEAGFRIVDRDQFLATDPEVVDPTRFVPDSGML